MAVWSVADVHRSARSRSRSGLAWFLNRGPGQYVCYRNLSPWTPTQLERVSLCSHEKSLKSLRGFGQWLIRDGNQRFVVGDDEHLSPKGVVVKLLQPIRDSQHFLFYLRIAALGIRQRSTGKRNRFASSKES